MKNTIRWMLAVAVVLSLGVVQHSVVLGQAGEQPNPGQSEATQSEEVQVITGLMSEGELRAVDTDESFLLVVGEDGKEMQFHYDAQTEVVGGEQGAEGLTGQTGAWLSIEYRAEGDMAIAETIEIGPRRVE